MKKNTQIMIYEKRKSIQILFHYSKNVYRKLIDIRFCHEDSKQTVL